MQTNYIEVQEVQYQHEEDLEILENLDNPDEIPVLELEVPIAEPKEQMVIHDPYIDHQLRPSISRSNFSSLSIPMDPFTKMEVSMLRNIESQTSMHQTIVQKVIHHTD